MKTKNNKNYKRKSIKRKRLNKNNTIKSIKRKRLNKMTKKGGAANVIPKDCEEWALAHGCTPNKKKLRTKKAKILQNS